MTAAHLSDVAGWWSEVFGLLGSILLVVPLFFLLKARDAKEDLDNREGLNPEDAAAMESSSNALSARLRRAHSTIYRITVGGTFCLLIALALTILQAGAKDWDMLF
jgi:hypothetical protein